MTMWTAYLANINVGVITVIWSFMPLIQAICDYYLFKQKLTYNLYIGMTMIIFTSVLLSLQNFILTPDEGAKKESEIKEPIATWIPVLFGIFTPFFFTSGNLIIRFMNEDTYGMEFTSDQIAFNPMIYQNVLVLIAGLVYWNTENPI